MSLTEEQIACLRLYRTSTIGPISYRHLLARYHSARRALSAAPSLAAKVGRHSQLRLASSQEIEKEYQALKKIGGRFVFDTQPEYPRLLKLVPDAPPVFSAVGDCHQLTRPVVAMVGARLASAAGVGLAAQFSAELGQAGYTIVSGLAKGIDGACHHAALTLGTIGVHAAGLHHPYPLENQGLFDQMVRQQGCIISEQPIDMTPTARLFPRRNRLIAGIALATIVVEAGIHSGSLVTARYAIDYGREVAAVPGSPQFRQRRGCNQLIQQGAMLIETAQDAIRLLEGCESLWTHAHRPTLESPDQIGAPIVAPDRIVAALPEAGLPLTAVSGNALSPTDLSMTDLSPADLSGSDLSSNNLSARNALRTADQSELLDRTVTTIARALTPEPTTIDTLTAFVRPEVEKHLGAPIKSDDLMALVRAGLVCLEVAGVVIWDMLDTVRQTQAGIPN